jgi:Putative peptidoglycan binding domain
MKGEGRGGRDVKKQMVVAAGCLLLAFTVSGQNVSQSQSPSAPAQPQPKQQQKSKPVRIQGSPKPGGGGGMKAEGGGKKGQNQGQDQGHGQANVQNQKSGSGNPSANTNTNKISYAEIRQRHRKERHDQNWWRQHFTVIVLVGGGYYCWDAGYWCPAWGYDPAYETYDYDGPIYTYGNLLPDQVIVNVQRALKQLGYYAGGTTGSLGLSTRQALVNFQTDNGLEVTGAIDAATVEALGLY